MTAIASLRASQRAAGQPIRVNASWVFDDAGYTENDEYGVGVTTSGTTPTNKSAFAHADTYWDVASFGASDYRQRVLDTVRTALTNRVVSRGNRSLDANYVAGRYMWAYAARTDGTFQSLSTSYHIT